jgi:hypothetical protein
MNQTNRVKLGLMATVFLVCSLALYQAFLPVVLIIVIIHKIYRIITRQDDKLFDYHLVPIIFGGVLYYLINKLVLLIFQLDANKTYSVFNLSVLDLMKLIPKQIITSYNTFYQIYFTNQIVKHSIIDTLFIVILMIWFIICIVRTIIANHIEFPKIIYVTLLLLLLPVFLSIVTIISPNKVMRTTLSAPYTVLLFCIYFILTDSNSKNRFKLPRILLLLPFILLVYSQILLTNATYEYQRQVYNQTLSHCQMVLNDVLKNPSYTKSKPIMFVGGWYLEDHYGNLYVENMGQPVKTLIDYSGYIEDSSLMPSIPVCFELSSNNYDNFFATELGQEFDVINQFQTYETIKST